MKLSPAQIDCIKHRLEVLEDSEVFGEPKPMHFDTAFARVQLLVNRGNIPDSLTELEKEILVECIEGSTYAACIQGRIADPTEETLAINRANKTLEVLADKFEPMIGRRIVLS